MPGPQLSPKSVNVETSGTWRCVNLYSVTDVSEGLPASVFVGYREDGCSNVLRSVGNQIPINTASNLKRWWLPPITFSKAQITPKWGQSPETVRNRSMRGIRKYETRGSEVNKWKTTNTHVEAVWIGLFKVDMPAGHELHQITPLLLAKFVHASSNNALRHTQAQNVVYNFDTKCRSVSSTSTASQLITEGTSFVTKLCLYNWVRPLRTEKHQPKAHSSELQVWLSESSRRWHNCLRVPVLRTERGTKRQHKERQQNFWTCGNPETLGTTITSQNCL
jgi:hypothetical protein